MPSLTLPATADFYRLRQRWNALGSENLFSAALGDSGKNEGPRDLADFLRTGDAIVDRYYGLLQQNGASATFDHVLDFGCGVGRLTFAWTRFARNATGIDISESMIKMGRQILTGQRHVRLEVNSSPDLSLFADASFDLVFSHIVLQYIPWKITKEYLREFVRVCKEGGWIVFQLPSGSAGSRSLLWLRRWFGELRAFRDETNCRISPIRFDMHFTNPSVVQPLMDGYGAVQIYREADNSAGAGTRGFIYLFQNISYWRWM